MALLSLAPNPYFLAAGVTLDLLLGDPEYRAHPVHEAMQPAVRSDNVGARAQQQMERVAKDDLGAQAFELLWRHRLHPSVGSHGHERRRFDDAVRSGKPA